MFFQNREKPTPPELVTEEISFTIHRDSGDNTETLSNILEKIQKLQGDPSSAKIIFLKENYDEYDGHHLGYVTISYLETEASARFQRALHRYKSDLEVWEIWYEKNKIQADAHLAAKAESQQLKDKRKLEAEYKALINQYDQLDLKIQQLRKQIKELNQ